MQRTQAQQGGKRITWLQNIACGELTCKRRRTQIMSFEDKAKGGLVWRSSI